MRSWTRGGSVTSREVLPAQPMAKVTGFHYFVFGGPPKGHAHPLRSFRVFWVHPPYGFNGILRTKLAAIRRGTLLEKLFGPGCANYDFCC